MTNIKERCEVRVNGRIYTYFTSVQISWNLDDNQALHFSLQTAEIDEEILKLQPMDRVDISLAGHELVKNGYILTRQAAIDSDTHATQLDGSSRAGTFWRASVDPGTEGKPGVTQLQGYTFSAIANKLLAPIGVKYRELKLPKGANEPFKNVILFRDESIFSALNRLAYMRNIWIAVDPKTGDIVGGDSQGGKATDLIEGQNIWSARYYLQVPHGESLMVYGQQQGDDSVSGRRSSEVRATAKVANGPPGTSKVILAEEPMSANEAKLRADKLAREIEASSWKVWATHPTFEKPGGGLWQLREPVNVTCPSLFPSGFRTQAGLVYGVQWLQDARGGTRTTVEIVNPRVAGDPGATPKIFGGADPAPAKVDNHDERGADQPAL